jgi:hypothetical protein
LAATSWAKGAITTEELDALVDQVLPHWYFDPGAAHLCPWPFEVRVLLGTGGDVTAVEHVGESDAPHCETLFHSPQRAFMIVQKLEMPSGATLTAIKLLVDPAMLGGM